MKNIYALVFRGTIVNFEGAFRASWATVHDVQHVVLGYSRLRNGDLSRVPSIVKGQGYFKTLASAKRFAADHGSRIERDLGDVFIVRVEAGKGFQGIFEITDPAQATTFTAKGIEVAA
jgi:hypothetical protein